ncbi:hypothetical protein KR50_36340 [Jeotgalibacillus campisalis]|uniref:Uncharacterized protein n=1 Tax=Jeotgalibacillus campisalis TaxID=220754 RepID=A0A0C2VFC0_9BACL|nr:hypothetical protein KR50_36340 [Jeotgalibacillus campisalis]
MVNKKREEESPEERMNMKNDLFKEERGAYQKTRRSKRDIEKEDKIG